MIAGMILWAYTLVLPTTRAALDIPYALTDLIPSDTPSWLEPTALFGITGLDPLTHGVFWSLFFNLFFFIFISRISRSRLVDRIQATAFINVHNKDISDQSRLFGHVTVEDLEMLSERFLGASRTRHAFTGFALQRGDHYPLPGDKASPELIQYTERMLAGAIGASSARIVMDSTLRGKTMMIGDVVTIVDEASKALRFNRSLLQSTIENIGLGISVVDQQMRLVAWNRKYIEMFNYPDGLICIGRPIEDVFRHNAKQGEYGPGDINEHIKARIALLLDNNPHSYERMRPDGSVLQIRGNPMPNGGYVNTYMDITDHKAIEEALRESEQNIRIYTDNVPVLIAYLDPQMRYLFINKAYADVFGLDRHRVAGIPCYSVLTREEYEYRRYYIDKALSGERQRFETKLPTKDGSDRFAEVTYIPHMGEHGDLLGYFTLYQDITERRIAELALQETNENLEQRVRERTQALSVVNKELRKENTIRALIEDELRQAKSDAEAANLGKTRFLAAASHDLLQPLNAARLFISALAQKTYEPDVNQLVENLDGSLRAAEELITTILDISKLDAGALEPSPSHFSLSNLINNLSTEFKALASERNLEYRYVCSKQVIYSDPKLLRRVLQNFLSNAMRYTKTGKVLLGARREGHYLRLEVWDTGVGIAENKIKEVFEEFKRIDNPRHSEVKGLGLGLAITERIARMLGHDINVRSWPGKGSVFSVRVPLGDPALEVKSKPEKRGWIRSKGLNGIHVLVIDNEPKILEGMNALLEGWSCHVLTALNADSAEQAIRERNFTPDIILADYHLSDVHTGVMALEQLSELWRQPVPSIVITADRTEAVKDEIEQIGAQLLTKPIKPAALRAMINKLIAQNREE
ncbi:Virulence sensor protein BvgS precursor [Nitrincola nitratireducens]|uniref:histidine kinase n=2 Tax=Nitrincola TaxID=267849 RepID=W9UZS5_9GAMM|nr:Virulence sensor protein BvgS precursor [Nitrincola nitratireducens]